MQFIKKYLQAKNTQNKTNLFLKFKMYRNTISNLLKLSKKNYYSEYFNTNINNIKNTWKGIKEIINIKPSQKHQPTSLNINNELITDKISIANSFNDFFSTIASKLSDKIVPTNISFDAYLNNPNPNSFFVQAVTEDEVSNYINSLETGKSNGPNSIPTNLLKLVSNTISNPLTSIINKSFSQGVFPDLLKMANVIPIFKKGSKLDVSNYRPISLLSNISKIFENLMQSRLHSFLEKFQCLYKLQFGFRNKHSTTHTLIDIVETIRKTIDDGNYACGVFIDLQKAFDTVNHKILITKLRYYGIRGTPLNWFQTYLNNRSQFVSINGISSSIRNISTGVPQGSILGPLLFLIYINDLNKCIKHAKTYHFADDTNLLEVNSSLKLLNKNINHDLSSLVKWLRANKISLNANKTELVIFKSKHKKLTKNLNFRISGQKIIPVHSIKYLGIKLDENLTFQPHINDLSIKLSRSNGMLSKIRHYITYDTLISIYHAIFNSHIRYGCQVWGLTTNQSLKRIVSLQNKAMRIIHFQPPFSKPDLLYYLSNTVKLVDQIKILNCLFVWEHQHSKLPTAFNNFFTLTKETHRHNLRSVTTNNLFVPSSRTVKYGINSITHQCVYFVEQFT